MVVDDFKHCFGRQKTQVCVLFVRVNYFKHPKDRARVDHVLLVRCVVLNIEVYHVDQLVQDSSILGVQKCLENVHEKFFIELIELEFTFV